VCPQAHDQSGPVWCLVFSVEGGSRRGTTRAEDAQGTPTQSHISPSIIVYEATFQGERQSSDQAEARGQAKSGPRISLHLFSWHK